MKQLTYIFHSGFAYEGEDVTLVFDFWKDPAAVLPRLLRRDAPLYVLASHFHEDHFNPEVLAWADRRPDIRYLLSKDILKRRRAVREAATAWMAKGAVYEDDRVRVTAFGSTDSGVSWLVETEGLTLFHAGDLNNWHWTDESTSEEVRQAEKMYLGELKDIRKQVGRMDVAMFPVDARIGSDYMRGARQFLERFPCRLFVPMHFSATGFASAAAFAPCAEEHGAGFWAIGQEGESRGVDR